MEQNKLTSQEIVDLTRTLNYGTWRFQKGWMPMHLADAEGCMLTDGAASSTSISHHS